MRVMVMFKDPDGLPRAYGVAPTEAEALRIAEEHLVYYMIEKDQVGDRYLSEARYTKDVCLVE